MKLKELEIFQVQCEFLWKSIVFDVTIYLNEFIIH